MGSPATRPATLACGAIIVAAVALLYSGAISGGFVYDDKPMILKSEWITDPSLIWQILTQSAWGEGSESQYYRPVMNLVFLFCYQISGFEPWSYHAVNVLCHGANSVLVFLIALGLLSRINPDTGGDQGASNRLVALFAALLFAANPLGSEPTSWIAAISELSFAFFFLLSFHLYTISTKGDRLKRAPFILSLITFFLSTLSKETSFMLLPAVVLYDLVLREEGWRKLTDRAHLVRYLPFVGVMVLYMALRLSALGEAAHTADIHADLSTFQALLNVPALVGRYLVKLALPINLTIFYDIEPVRSPGEWIFLASLAGLILLAAFIWFIRKRAPHAAFLLLWIVVPLLPVLYIPVLSKHIIADRYLYMSCVPFAIGTAMLISYISARVSARRGAVTFLIITSFIVALYSAGTRERVRNWQSDLTIWSAALEKSPGSYYVNYNVGAALYNEGRVGETIAYYKKALEIYHYDYNLHYDIALAYIDKKNYRLAIEHLQTAIKGGLTTDPDTYVNLGNSYARTGELILAIENYRLALALDPANELAFRNLEVVEGALKERRP